MSRYCLPLSIYPFHLAAAMEDFAIPYRHIELQYETISGWKTAGIRLARPDTLNCVDAAMAEELRYACQQVRADDNCRLVMVTGSGRFFSTGRARLGGDGAAGTLGENGADRANDIERDGNLAQQLERLRVADALASLPIPVIIAINGDAAGHGLELALAGDLRIASETAQFALCEPGQPSLPWDGGTQRLPRLVGPAWALDMALTGRRLDSTEALRIGLVNRVAPASGLAEATREMAESVLASAPIAARFGKEAVRKGMDLTLEQGLRLEADLSVILQSTGDRSEGIASFAERRPPRFTGA